MLKIPHPVGYGYAVKHLRGEWQVEAILVHEPDGAVKSGFSHFLFCHGYHAGAEVYAGDASRTQFLEHEHGEVAGTGRHIQNMLWRLAPQHIDRAQPPQLIDAESHHPVHEVVSRSYGVKHLSYLLRLATAVIVGIYLFSFYFHDLA